MTSLIRLSVKVILVARIIYGIMNPSGWTKHESTWECAHNSGRGVPYLVNVKGSRVSLLYNVHVRKLCMCLEYIWKYAFVLKNTSFLYFREAYDALTMKSSSDSLSVFKIMFLLNMYFE
jgi:hypothetical protein